jgi:hypothetical protein
MRILNRSHEDCITGLQKLEPGVVDLAFADPPFNIGYSYDVYLTFQAGQIRVPSVRQLVYGDSRANPTGRLPDDTWILRPQDLPDGFSADQDAWYFPRVAGTFREREGFHGCQMPEQLLGRIIRAGSREGEVVLDPFGGSGTTLAVAMTCYGTGACPIIGARGSGIGLAPNRRGLTELGEVMEEPRS